MEQDAGPRVKGQIFAARFEFLQRTYGADSINRVIGALPVEDRERLQGVDRESWYAFGALARLDAAIAELLAPGDPSIFDRLGEASSRHRTEWLGEHASLISVHGFLARAADEHHRFHSFGRAVYRRDGFTEGELAFSEYPEVYETFCRTSRGYFRGVLEYLTGAPAEVEERQCQARGDAACVFRMRWAGRAEPG